MESVLGLLLARHCLLRLLLCRPPSIALNSKELSVFILIYISYLLIMASCLDADKILGAVDVSHCSVMSL